MIVNYFAGYITGMELKGILTRIERRLKATGLSADAACMLAKKPDAIRNLRRAVRNGSQGRSGLSTATLEALAPILKTTVPWLISEEGPENIDDVERVVLATAVPLISMVQAGELVKPEYVERFDDAPKAYTSDLDPKGLWVAFKVKGDSMDLISPPDSIIFVNLRDRRLVSNACYIISDDDGGSSYKRYRPGVWQPVSQNKTHKTYEIRGSRGPRVIGRVRKTVLSM